MVLHGSFNTHEHNVLGYLTKRVAKVLMHLAGSEVMKQIHFEEEVAWFVWLVKEPVQVGGKLWG